MTRRFPPPIPGLPETRDRYRVILESLESLDSNPTREEFVSICKEAIEHSERDTSLSQSWTEQIINDLIRSGFIRESTADSGPDVLEVENDSQRWLNGDIDFSDCVFNALKRGWVIRAKHPEGFEALERILHAITYEIGGPTSSRELRKVLEREYDYQFSEQGLRGYPRLLKHMGYLAEADEGLVIPDEVYPDDALGRLRAADIFRKYENWLRREGALVEPPSKAGKRALMKYYMYRESSGWRKRKQWYRQFHRNYLTPSVREGNHTEPALRRKSEYPDNENRRKRLRDEISEDFDIDKDRLQGLSVNDLQRISEADNPTAAQRTLVQCGSGVSRADLGELIDENRPYTFPEEFELYDWQSDAAEKWFEGTERTAPKSGIAEVVTGAGKTILALEVIRRWLDQTEDRVVTVVVPTRVLMYQWMSELTEKLNVPVDQIGWAGDGHRNRFVEDEKDIRILVTIVNTAVKDDFLGNCLEEIGRRHHLLIADECHNYTGDVHSKVLKYHNTATLGLSATPTEKPHSERKASEDEQLLFEHLGDVFYTLTYSGAIEQELIPSFEINYVGFDLTPEERPDYEALSREISEALKDIRNRYSNRLHQLGGNLHQKLNVISNNDESDHPAIGKFFTLTQERRELVQNAISRQAITLELLRDIEPDEKTIVFQERIEQLEQLVAPFERLGMTREWEVSEDEKYDYRSKKYAQYPELEEVDKQIEELFADSDFWPVMYHSGHRRDIWNEFAMEWFRAEEHANVMYSVKALIEGIDVPDADKGIIRVSSGSVRQRIQTLGRILRTGDDPDKVSKLYVLYARNTVDESIFREYDWDEQLGNADVVHKRWVTDDSPLDGKIRQISDPLPDGHRYEEPDYPDADELEPGDEYTGPNYGYRISVDAEGRPFEKHSEGRRFITNPKIKEAAKLVHDRKGGGTIIINDRGHMVTKLLDETIFLGITEGTDSFEYDESAQRSLTDQPPEYDDIFGA